MMIRRIVLSALACGAPASAQIAPSALHGSVVDSLSGAPVAGARVVILETSQEGRTDARGSFEVQRPQPGEYTFEIHTASLDSLSTTHRVLLTIADTSSAILVRAPSGKQVGAALCGAASDSGVVVGTMYVQNKAGARSGANHSRVTAEWMEPAADTARLRRVDVPGASDGRFRVCGIPVGVSVTLRALADSAEMTSPHVVQFPPGTRLSRVELVLATEADLTAFGATFAGTVVVDSIGTPAVGAEVTFPELDKSVLTDTAGKFRVLGIPPGQQHLRVRRLGYAAEDATIKFAGHETVERRVVLGKAITLEPVIVFERVIDRSMQGFEENRKLGLGSFLTRTQLEKFTGMKLSTAMQQLSNFGFVEGRGSAFPSSRLAPMCKISRDVACYAPTPVEIGYGIRRACYAQVYLNGLLVNGPRQPTEPFDINTIPPESVEAIEYYATAAETPMRYSRFGSQCGVVVIWWRKS